MRQDEPSRVVRGNRLAFWFFLYIAVYGFPPLLAAFGARSVFWLLVAVVAVAFLIMCTSLRTSRRSFAELAR